MKASAPAGVLATSSRSSQSGHCSTFTSGNAPRMVPLSASDRSPLLCIRSTMALTYALFTWKESRGSDRHDDFGEEMECGQKCVNQEHR